MAKQNLLLSFTTQEFEHQHKGPGWYITAVVIALIFIAYFYYTFQDIFGIVTIVILAGLTLFFANQQPRPIEVQISDLGVTVGSSYFSYTTLKRFWIAEHAGNAELHLETTAYLNRYITLLLAEELLDDVTEILSQFIPESEAEPESLSAKLARKLRF